MRVLDPTIQMDDAQDTKIFAPAPRLGSLDGRTVGLWNNTKLNSVAMLEMIRAELEKRYKFFVVRGSYNPSRQMSDDEWGEVDRCDVVILANGDCGACSTSGIVNAIDLEKRGIPTMLVSTTPFKPAVTMTAAMNGMPSITWAVVEHPLASLGEDELLVRAAEAAEQFPALVLESPQLASANR